MIALSCVSASLLTSVLPFLPRNARPEPPKRLVNLEPLDENLRDRWKSLRPGGELHYPDARLGAHHEGHGGGGRILGKVCSLLLRIFIVLYYLVLCLKFCVTFDIFCI